MRASVLALLVAGCTGTLGNSADEAGCAGDAKCDSLLSGTALGATVTADGALFAVWAPNADEVYVTGDFDAWAGKAHPLERGQGGVFSGAVPGAKAGQEYGYLVVRGQSEELRPDPRAARMRHSNGHSVLHDPAAYSWTTAGFQTPPWEEQVVYELHLGTFNDAPGGAPGTWKSARERLADLADLGVNMLEVMPPAEFSGDYSWGYNPAAPFAPETIYGTPEDAKAFIDEAHRLGMGVIIDVVHNHWGPQDLGALWCFDLECYGAGGIYFYSDWRRTTPWGDTRPDYGRREVREYIRDNALMWLREYRADGLRWDSTINIRQKDGQEIADGWRVLQEVNDAVDEAQPWKIMIAEDLANDAWITKPTIDGGAGFDSQWDAQFFHPIDDAIVAANDSERHMFAVRDAIVHGYDGRANHRVIYTESHDEVANGKARIPEMIWPGHADSYYARKRSTLGAAIVMTAPGIPMIFQGQEILEDGWFQDTDPVDWAKEARFPEIRALYRDLIRLRRNLDGHSRGLRGDHVNVFHVNDSDKVIAFHRWASGGAGDDVVVVANFSNRAFTAYDLGLPRGGTWKVRFNSDWSGYGADYANTASNDTTAWSGGRDGLDYHGTIGVGPYTVIILSQ